MSGSKKLLNNPDQCVDDCLKGVAAANPRVSLNSEHRVIVFSEISDVRRVGVLSGGGSGHEPFPAGYVGAGMLTGAVCGSVFASPPSTNVLYAIRAVSQVSPGGVLVLIPNYTGDLLNFGLAIELARAEGINVDSLVIGDDIAQSVDGQSNTVGRRGTTGLVAVFKIAGATAAQGASLEEVKTAAYSVNAATLGLALDGATLPGAPTPLFSLGNDEMELGVGVHGEAGIRRQKLVTASEAVKMCLQHITSYLHINMGQKVVLLVNNLGGLSQIEQWVVVGEIHRQLKIQGVKVARTYAGPLFTSIDMPGVQICIIHASTLLPLFDAFTCAPAWPGRLTSTPIIIRVPLPQSDTNSKYAPRGPRISTDIASLVKRCLSAVTASLQENELRLNELDSGCGDGDCGTTLKNLAVAIDRKAKNGELNFEFPATLGAQLAAVAASSMGGTSGAIYSLLLTNAADAVTSSLEGNDFTSGKTWAAVWRGALEGVQKYSRARVGDRTMFDALEPALVTFESNCLGKSGTEALELAVNEAVRGCEATISMKAKAGRASYVDVNRVTEVDAGAYAVTVWLKALYGAITNL